MTNLVKNKILVLSPALYWVILALIVALSVIWRIRNISGFSDNYDEGAHLMEAWLLSQGFTLYQEIFLPLPPLLVQPLAWLFQFTGPSVIAARLLEITYACIGLIAIAGLGRHFGTIFTGWLAAILLSMGVGYFSLSRISLGNVPATALGVLSLYWGWLYFTQGRQYWLLLAGLIASISLLIKPLFISAPIMLLILVVVYHLRCWLATKSQKPGVKNITEYYGFIRRQRVKILNDGLSLSLGLTLPFLLVMMVYNNAAMFNQVIIFRYQLAQSQVKDISSTIEHLTYFLNNNNRGLPLLALIGLIQLLLSAAPYNKGAQFSQSYLEKSNNLHLYQKWFVVIWLGLTLGSIFGFESLHSHHLVSLEPILALLGALAVGYAVDKQNWSAKPFAVNLVLLFSIVAIVLYIRYLPKTIVDQMEALPQGSIEEQENWQAIQLLKKLTSANQFILSDDLFIAFEAQRQVIPRLSDPSEATLEADYITDETAIQLANQHAQAVVAWSGRFHNHLPLFMQWVERNFTESVAFGDDRIIYFNKKLPQIPFPVRKNIGNVLNLEGYGVHSTDSNKTELTLYWRKLLDEDNTDYAMTIRVLDKNNQNLAQVDIQPFQGRFPTSDWPTDILLWDTIMLDLPLTRLSQSDKVLIGVYDPKTLQLLTIRGTKNNFIELRGIINDMGLN